MHLSDLKLYSAIVQNGSWPHELGCCPLVASCCRSEDREFDSRLGQWKQRISDSVILYRKIWKIFKKVSEMTSGWGIKLYLCLLRIYLDTIVSRRWSLDVHVTLGVSLSFFNSHTIDFTQEKQKKLLSLLVFFIYHRLFDRHKQQNTDEELQVQSAASLCCFRHSKGAAGVQKTRNEQRNKQQTCSTSRTWRCWSETEAMIKLIPPSGVWSSRVLTVVTEGGAGGGSGGGSGLWWRFFQTNLIKKRKNSALIKTRTL